MNRNQGNFNARNNCMRRDCFNFGRHVCSGQRKFRRRSRSVDPSRANSMWNCSDVPMRNCDYFGTPNSNMSIKPVWESLHEPQQASTSRQQADNISNYFGRNPRVEQMFDQQPYQPSNNAHEVMKKMISLFLDKKKSEKEGQKDSTSKLTKRIPLPPFTGTKPIGEEGITAGIFCKYCRVFCTDQEMANRHVLTKVHYKKYKEFLKTRKED
ncbi:hypothetical protein O3M35_001574 [Rhynocoris fuscipes]|uniref:U1-type domain-containing protein n=1 Tax=Rhynocoris fuscipes TaxID=488301 RepID=A0AAW1CMZ9_9HEMI